MEKSNFETATVVKHTGSHYLVSKLPEWNLIPCVVRGKLRMKESGTTNPIAVGDIVDYQQEEGGTGAIIKIHPRRNYIIRKSTNLSRQSHIIASNLDTAFLVVTLDFPETKTAFIDRFLVTCEAYRVPVKIILNKCDLISEEYAGYLEAFKKIYNNAGYEVVEISALTGHNVEIVRNLCKGRISLFSGQSGVGKSSLINALDSALTIKTAEISHYHLQGKHTTTFYEMHPLESGGFIIDTPGIKGFGLIEMAKEELSHYFPEMLKVTNKCKYSPCTHTHEPGCAVKDSVDAGTISPERYLSYLGMLEDEDKYR
ncbi:MAG: ribosome small subunit-dependent GTPase A [Bacteroidales bacterium]|nr:rsgA [Bacteroidota bacterium]MCE5321048.1 ribosome small subunit-dependent GTPase A [Bacteroidales bacterium]MDD2280558.1 ribosome small subunit-dependent GTPase A [Bacteroidales bacterium]MDD4292634.1 ribosome small subunit-dependent GTPase A [Bacteroidales bacterium]MDD4491411.1 ribosome small subunit-dependent GTPase A [Bacteroidales bacterium]